MTKHSSATENEKPVSELKLETHNNWEVSQYLIEQSRKLAIWQARSKSQNFITGGVL